MEFRAGDVQLLHNHTLLHDRTGFEEWPNPIANVICCDSAWRHSRPAPFRRFLGTWPGERGFLGTWPGERGWTL
jgi:hypothetical protein